MWIKKNWWVLVVVTVLLCFTMIAAGLWLKSDKADMYLQGNMTLGNGTQIPGSIYVPSYNFTATDFAVSGRTVSLDRNRNIVLTAGSGTPSTTGPCADPEQVEIVAGIDWIVADFDATTDESLQWGFIFPDEWGADATYTITAVFEWTVAAAAGAVTWGIQGGSYADNEAPTLGTAIWVNDTAGTAARPYFSAVTAAVTLAGTPAAGEHGQIKVLRDADNSEGLGDTLAADARLIAVKVIFHAK